MKRSLRFRAAAAPGLALALVSLAANPAPLAAAVDPALLAGLEARSIGPAAMSGRIAAIESSPAHPEIVYVGAATGGLWKSVNGGTNWEPIFDDQPVASIGAIALDPHNPDVVWVGTGEGNPRNSVSVGNGVYKSLDGGHTWRHLGLDKTEHIDRILVDPDDPQVAYVGALGQVWGENPERGVYKTEDGGATWKRVLYVDERTGVADLVMDPANPRKLFAALWDFQRQPWTFRSGGPGSGLYVTYDGGATWKKQTEDDGLPKGQLGRIGLAIAPSEPNVVYALVEAAQSALLRSNDGGRTWKAVNTDSDVNPRPFYFDHIFVDSADPGRLYRLFTNLSVSDDGGKTFTLIGARALHADHHAFWIDPRNPLHIWDGNDGGAYESHDRGATWRFMQNLPVGQFYHVRLDNAVPYNVYGGLQDNGSWKGPSNVWEQSGIRNHHWSEVGFGDGFDTVPDPNDTMRGYSMSQEGHLMRWDLRTGERKDIRPAGPNGEEPRFNWNAGIAIDPFDPNTLYFGSQWLHKTTDRGDSWTILSPDLTTNNPEWQKADQSGGITIDATGAESFTTILAIAPSPVQRGVIWVGTDDGRLHVTRDGGKSWDSLEKNVHGVPANTWIPHISPSPSDAGTAFVVFDNHRRSDWTPYVYRTTDYGKTWTSLATKNLWGYALAIEQDPVDKNLLFLGTEFGLWVSQDGGKSWMKWTHGVPTVSVMDLAIHPREHDLVIATHGRGLYIIDDIRPLRTLTEETQKQPLHLFPVADAQQARIGQGAGMRVPGDADFRGRTRPYGALITYSLNAPGLPHPDADKEREHGEHAEHGEHGEYGEHAAPQATGAPPHPQGGQPLAGTPAEPKRDDEADEGRGGRGRGPTGPKTKVEILDAAGKVIRTFDGPAKLGVNRAAWDLRFDAPRRIPRRNDAGGEENEFRRGRGPDALPGTYTVRVSYGAQKAEGKVNLLGDPRYQIASGAREANFKALQRATALSNAVVDAVDRITRTRTDVNAVAAKLRKQDEDAKRTNPAAEDPARKDLLAAARRLNQGLEKLERRFWQGEAPKHLLRNTDFESRIGGTARGIGSSWDPPTPAQLAYLDREEKDLNVALADLNKFFAEDVAAFRAKVRDVKIELLPDTAPLQIEGAPSK
jgi:photosystem II stability/assembly factor-like uncharacterized protein